MVHSMFLLDVKKPEESKYPWDDYKVLAEGPGDQAFRSMMDGGCQYVKNDQASAQSRADALSK